MSWGRSNFLAPGAVPNSKVVQSNDEWMQDWQSKMAATPQYLSTTTPTFTNVQDMINAGQVDQAFDLIRQAGAAGSDYRWDNRGGTTAAGDFNPGSLMVKTGQTTTQELNPAWGNMSSQYQKEGEARAYDQKRQATAYGQMQGGNYFGGMIDGRYGEAFSGQMQQGAAPGNGDPTSGSAWGAPGTSTFGETFGQKPKQYRAGGWGSYGW